MWSVLSTRCTVGVDVKLSISFVILGFLPNHSDWRLLLNGERVAQQTTGIGKKETRKKLIGKIARSSLLIAPPASAYSVILIYRTEG